MSFYWRDRLLEIAIALMGAMIYITIYGATTLNPFNIRWLIQGDHAIHLIGWLFYKAEPWHFPLGRIDGLLYPIGTSTIYTDSIPWLAALAKIFSSVLAQPFQYVGLWLLLCYALQSFFGYRLMRLWYQDPVLPVLSAAFFTISPILIDRFGHVSLSAHWLLLAGLWRYFRQRPNHGQERNELAWWVVVNVVAVLTNPYLVVMTLILAMVTYIKNVFFDHTLDLRLAGRHLLLIVLTTLSSWIAFGFGGTTSAQSGGFGLFSADLLTFFNPRHYSAFLPALPATPYQYEGFAYLGAGMLLLGVITLGQLWLRREKKIVLWTQQLPLIAVSILLLLLALSNQVTLGGYIILNLGFIYDPFIAITAIFRSSGRFIWLPYYAVMIFLLVYGLQSLRYPLRVAVCALTLVLQFFDLHEAYARQRFMIEQSPPSSLLSPSWQLINPPYTTVALVPPYIPFGGCAFFSTPNRIYHELAVMTAVRGLTINSGIATRLPPLETTITHCQTLLDSLAQGHLDSNVIYIVDRDYLHLFDKATANCQRIDTIDVCVKR